MVQRPSLAVGLALLSSTIIALSKAALALLKPEMAVSPSVVKIQPLRPLMGSFARTP